MATQPQPVVAGQSTLPPAYSEKQDLGAGGNQQPAAGYIYPQPVPTAPQAWPQGYPVGASVGIGRSGEYTVIGIDSSEVCRLIGAGVA